MNLTKREQEIANLVAKGLTNQDIGQRLYIEKRTVETHLNSIFNKIGIKNRVELVVWVFTGEPKLQSEMLAPLTAEQIKFLATLVSSPGLTADKLAKLLGISYHKTYRELSKLLRRQIIFEYHLTKGTIQWFPTIVGLAIYKNSKDLKCSQLKNYLSQDETYET